MKVTQICSLLSFLLLLTTISCKEKTTPVGIQTKVDIQIGESTETIPFSDYIDSIKAISVYENDSHILGNIKKVEKSNNLYYILNQKKDAIFKCEGSGKILAILRRVGHSKDEYTQILDYSVDETNKTLVTLCSDNKLMVYDLSFNLKYTKRLRMPIAAVCAFGGDIYCYSNNRQILKVVDNGFDVLLKGEELAAYIYECTPIFHKIGNRVLATMEYDNTIYEITDGVPKPFMAYSYPKLTKAIERMQESEVKIDFEDIVENSSVSIKNITLENGRLAIIYSYDMLMRICIIEAKSKKLLSDGIIIGDFPHWMTGTAYLGGEFAKDFNEKHAEDRDKIININSDNDDTNLIIEYYVNFNNSHHD